MTRDLSGVLAAIDGALGDEELPDGMRWSPEPASAESAAPVYAEEQPRRVLVVIGGTPAAEAVTAALSSPEAQERLRAACEELAVHIGLAFETIRAAMLAAAEAFRDALPALRDAGLLPEEPPTDPRARALWLRQNRGTGPDRDLTRQRRPRRLP